MGKLKITDIMDLFKAIIKYKKKTIIIRIIYCAFNIQTCREKNERYNIIVNRLDNVFFYTRYIDKVDRNTFTLYFWFIITLNDFLIPGPAFGSHVF